MPRHPGCGARIVAMASCWQYRLGMRITRLLALLLSGCTPAAPVSGTSGTSGTGEAPSTGAGSTSPTEGPTAGTSGSTVADASSAPGSTESSGEATSSTGGPTVACDVWAQDCPAGQKCAPYQGDGSSWWDGLECVPVVDDPAQPGEPCTLTNGPTSGADDCALGAYCKVDQPDNHGTCVPLCAGSADAPVCPAVHSCVQYNDVYNECTPWCDPIAQECSFDYKCIAWDDGWLCVPGGVVSEWNHQPCDYLNDCEAGLVCVAPDAALECDPMFSGCCEALCDVTAENLCTGAGQTCQAWYTPGEAPPGYENVGVCRV